MKVENAASEKHRAMMQTLAEFVGADVTYTDLGNGEYYRLTKDGHTITLQVRANRMDGGFLIVKNPTE